MTQHTLKLTTGSHLQTTDLVQTHHLTNLLTTIQNHLNHDTDFDQLDDTAAVTILEEAGVLPEEFFILR